MRRAIIRGLWGLGGSGHGDQTPGSLYKQAQATMDRKEPTDRVYVLGEENARILRDMGYPVVLIDPDPVGEIYSGHHINKMTQYGWGNKMLVIRQALEDYDEVAWVDFDMVLQRPIPNDYWTSFGKGPSFQFPMVIQRSTKHAAHWRRRKSIDVSKLVCGGTYMYFRKEEKDLIEKNIETHKIKLRWTGQKTMTYLFEKKCGSWMGLKEHLKRGHEISGYLSGFNLFLIPPEKALWIQGPGTPYEYTIPIRDRLLETLCT